jgi:hypothetical protein
LGWPATRGKKQERTKQHAQQVESRDFKGVLPISIEVSPSGSDSVVKKHDSGVCDALDRHENNIGSVAAGWVGCSEPVVSGEVAECAAPEQLGVNAIVSPADEGLRRT